MNSFINIDARLYIYLSNYDSYLQLNCVIQMFMLSIPRLKLQINLY